MSEPRDDRRSAERLRDWLEKGRVEDPADGGDRALRDVVLEARRLARDDDEARRLSARRVSQRVLAATVGEHSVLPFPLRVRRALKRSVLLRVVAASVLVHLLALPAVAWYVIAPETLPKFVLSFLPADDRGQGATEAGPTELDQVADEAERQGRIENRLRVDRYRLTGGELPAAAPDGAQLDSGRPRSAADWVSLRIELRGGQRGLPPSALTVDLDDPLTAIAVLDTCLDALALEVDLELAERGADRARRRVAALAAIEAPLDSLAPTALARAAAYGIGPNDPRREPAVDDPEGTDLGLWLRRVRDGEAELTRSEPWASWFVWADARR